MAASFDEEAFNDAVQWRKDGGKQTYAYPEDLDGSKPDPRCNHCGKTAYKAEVVWYNKIPYHKNCFKCLQCGKKLNPGEANPLGATTFVCNVHFQQIAMGTSGAGVGDAVSARTAAVKATGPSLITGANSGVVQVEEADLSAGHAFRKEGGKQTYRYPEDLSGPTAKHDPRCQKCGKTCYKAEVVTYERIPYHKECFKCMLCKKKLTPGSANPFGEDSFLCNVHFHQVIKGGKGGSTNGEVFSASSAQKKATGPSLITGSSDIEIDLSDGIQWRKNGVKQAYRYPEDIQGPAARADPRCQKCGKTSYKAETITYERIPYHKQCFKCVQCKRKLTAGDANPFGEDAYLCNVHYHQVVFGGKSASKDNETFSAASAEAKSTGPSLVVSAVSTGVSPLVAKGLEWRKAGAKQVYKYPEDVSGPAARADPRCNLCGKTCYKAEVITYERIPYHKNCFKCIQCNKRLTAGTANPFGEDRYLCNAHFQQFALQRAGAVDENAQVLSADSAVQEDAGPAVVGRAMPKRSKTSYKPPKRTRRKKAAA